MRLNLASLATPDTAKEQQDEVQTTAATPEPDAAGASVAAEYPVVEGKPSEESVSERKSSLTPRDFESKEDPTLRAMERRRSSAAMQLGEALRGGQAELPDGDDDDEPPPWTPRDSPRGE
jgi:hypothetical protein